MMEQVWRAGLVSSKEITIWHPLGPVNGHMPTLPKRTKVNVKVKKKT